MTQGPYDHDVHLWLDGPAWLAISREAEREDRSLSSHIRHILHAHLEASAAHERLARQVRAGSDAGRDA